MAIGLTLVIWGCSVSNPVEPGPKSNIDLNAAPSDGRILSAYYGLDKLPPRVIRICPVKSVRKNGVPVTFSVRFR